MDSTAINAIAALAAAEQTRIIAENQDYPVAVVPENHTIASLEQFNNRPNLFRGTFVTTVLHEFTSYLNDHGWADSAIFIDQDEMKAKAIIDFGNSSAPQWGKHVAAAMLKKTPAYAALTNNQGSSFAQQDLIDFAEDWAEHITFFDEANQTIDFKKTINTLRRVKVNANAGAEQTVGNFAASRSTLEQVEIKAGADELPAGFLFQCHPYDGFESRTFLCQLRASNSEKAVLFKYRIAQLEATKILIGNEFRALIESAISVDSLSIYLGNMAYQS